MKQIIQYLVQRTRIVGLAAIVLLPMLATAQPCDFTNDINLGATTGAHVGYTQIYFLLNATTNAVVQIANTAANFTGVAPGFYKIVVVNYDPALPPTPNPSTITVGAPYGFSGGCFEEKYYQGNTGTTVRVCTSRVCVGQQLLIGSSNYNTTAGFTQKYVLVCAGTITAFNATGDFGISTASQNGCIVHAINHNATITGLTVGQPFAGLGGCFEDNALTETVTIDPLPVVVIIGTPAVCTGACASLAASGAGVGGTYVWSGGTVSGTGNANTSVCPLVTTIYTVTATSAAGCSSTSSVQVVVNAIPPAPVITPVNPIICNAGTVTLDAGAGYTGYAWSAPTPTVITQTNTVANTGTYTVTVTAVGGCTATATTRVGTGTSPLITGPTTICDLTGTNYSFTFTVTAGSPAMQLTINGVATATLISGDVYNSALYPVAGVAPTVVLSNQCGTLPIVVSASCPPPVACGGPGCYGTNQVSNGDFEAGNTGFTSQYTYENCSSLTAACTLPSGAPYMCEYRYGVTSMPTSCISTWSPTLRDHTTGTGNLYVANYPSGSVGANTQLWCQTVNLAAATNYCFGGYFINLLPTSQTNPAFLNPQYQFTAAGSNLGAVTTAPRDEQWHFAGYQFNSGAGGNVVFCIQSANNGQLGNDIAIDDISLRAVTNGTLPTVVADAAVLCPGATSATINVLTNDAANVGTLVNSTLQVINPSSCAVTTVNQAAGTITFTPTATCTFPITFDYQICNTGGCCATNTVTITQAANPVVNITPNPAAICLGGNIVLNAGTDTGGAAFSTILWSVPIPNATQTITVAPSATTTYTVSVTNAAGCSNTSTRIVTVNTAPLTPIITGANTICGTNIALDAGAGYATYAWSGTGTIVGAANTQTVTVSTVGTYTCIVTNAAGCSNSASKTITIGSVTPPTITATIQCNGTYILDAGSGYTNYDWSSVAGANNGQTTAATTNGVYTVTVSGTGGCTATGATTVAIGTPVSIATSAPTNPTCNGGTNGSFTATGSGGVTPLVYSFAGGTFAAATTSPNYGAGTYSVIVRDANGCTASTNVTLTQPTAILVSANTTNTICGGAAGSAVITANGGTPAYTYSINTTPPISNQIGNTFNPLATGTYTVTVRDAALCTATVGFTISQLASTVGGNLISVTNVNCGAGATGGFQVIGSGGSGTYSTYAIPTRPSQSNGTFTALAAGTYTVTVTDNTGCTGTVSATILQNGSTITLAATTTNNVSCFGGNTGRITATASSGVPAYTYNMGTATNATGVFNNLTTGIYTVSVVDANGCTATASATIAQPINPLGLTFTNIINPSCFNGTNGSAALAVSGGTTPYTYCLDQNGFCTQNTANLVNLPNGAYVVRVTDAVGCTAFDILNISEQSAVTLTLQGSTNATCNGSSTGTATVLAGGGTVSYTYLIDGVLNTPSNNPTFTGLAPTTHTVTVRDSKGCSKTTTFTINEPAAISATATNIQNAACNGVNNGGFTLIANGGTPAYTYSGSGNGVYSGLASGTYTVTITDANACSITKTATVGQPSAITATITNQINERCSGGRNGSFVVSANGGSGGFVYAINPADPRTSNQFSGLLAGTYTVTITDINGCTATRSTTVLQPATAVSVTATTIQPVSCFGGNNGSVTLTATGGTGGTYEYALDNGNWQPNNPTFNQLAAGAHTVCARDVNGCSACVNFNIAQPTTVVTAAASTVTNVKCFGDNTGGFTVTSAGGSGSGYTYSIDGGTPSTNNVFINQIADNHQITVRDANNCSSATITVNLTQPSELKPKIDNVTDIACNSLAPSGAATLSAMGGTPPYTFTCTNCVPVQTNTTGVFSNLTGGTKSIEVRDANNCVKTLNPTIGAVSPMGLSLVSQGNITCKGATDGKVTVLGAGGSSAYEYSLDNQTSFASNNIFTGLTVGQHTIFVRNPSSPTCTASLSITITEPTTALTLAAATVSDVKCAGGTNGSITVNTSGGTPTYFYSYNGNPEQTNNTINGLVAGTYTISVRDAGGCISLQSAQVGQPLPLTIATPGVANTKCFGGNDGNITLAAGGGTGAYSYSLNCTGITSSVGQFTALSQGTYSVCVKDVNNCTSSVSVTVNEPAPLVVSVTNVQNILCAGLGGTVALNVSGGTPSFTYSIGTTAYTNPLLAVPAGAQTIRIQDGNACFTNVAVNISQSDVLVANAGISRSEVCKGGTAIVTASGNGGTGSYSYFVQPITNLSDTLRGVPQTIQPSLTTDYIMTVRDAAGCYSKDTITLTVNQLPIPDIVGARAICAGQAANLNVSAAYTGGYAWSTGEFTRSVVINKTGIYTVEVTDDKGCIGRDTAAILVRSLPTVNAGTNLNLYGGQPLTLNASSSAPNACYTWSAGVTQTPACSATASGIVPIDQTTYTVTITDVFGCESTDEVRVDINGDLGCLAESEGITPNGDGKNDVWFIPCIDFFNSNEVEIYNRWGQLIYSVKGYPQNYDGTYEGKALPDGTYYYVIKLYDDKAKKKLYKGTLSIIR